MSEFFSFPLLGYNLKSRTKNFIVWSLISLCIFILIIVMFTNILAAGLPDFLNDMLSSLPSSISNGKEVGGLPDFTDFGVNFGVCMQLMLVVGCVYACYLGASANSSGSGDSDITFIYAQPVTRLCTVLTSFAAQLATLLAYNLIVLLVSFAVIYSNAKPMYTGKILLSVLAFFLIEAVYLALAFLFSTFMNSGSQASSITAVTVTVTIVCSIIGSLAPALKFFKCLSPYSYISVYSIVSGASSSFLLGIIASIVIIIVCLVISCMRFEKIDFLLD